MRTCGGSALKGSCSGGLGIDGALFGRLWVGATVWIHLFLSRELDKEEGETREGAAERSESRVTRRIP
jgi:hypothetical protein